jgi:hypothetical protein
MSDIGERSRVGLRSAYWTMPFPLSLEGDRAPQTVNQPSLLATMIWKPEPNL